MTEHKSPVDDLFGDEPLPVEPQTSSSSPRFPIPQGGLAIGGAVLGVIIFFWWSSAHRDNYYLELDDGRVTIEQGWFFPFGSSEVSEGPAYEPFDLPGGIAAPKSGALTQSELDEELHRVYIDIAEKLLDEKDVEKSMGMLLRAQKLKTTGVAANREVEKLFGKANYLLGIESVSDLCGDVLSRSQRQMTSAKEKGHPNAERWSSFLEKLRADCRALARETNVDLDDGSSSEEN